MADPKKPGTSGGTKTDTPGTPSGAAGASGTRSGGKKPGTSGGKKS
jgi:hypothetical protein